MLVILQFCLIAILLEEGSATTGGVCYDNYACVKMTVTSLRIPDDNPMIKGEKNEASDSWYTYVHWLDKLAGNLTLYYITLYSSGDDIWTHKTTGTLNVYEEGKLERFEWTKLARKALGLNNSHSKIPGKLRVNRNLFSGDKCIGINFETPWPNTRTYYVYLRVADDRRKSFLVGYIAMNK